MMRQQLLLALLFALNAQAVPRQALPAACDYVQSLAEQQRALPADKPNFQLLTSLKVNGAKSLSTHNLKKIPHVLWGMAQTETNIDQLERKPIDMPSIDGFLLMAKKAYEDGKLSATKYHYLQFLDSIGSGSGLRSARAGAYQDDIEKNYPGVITGEPKAFADSRVFTEFLAANGLKAADFKAADWQVFQKWTLPLPLETATFSTARAEDIGMTLALVQRAASNRRSLSEQACAWQLRERFLSLVISLMGTKGAPKVTDSGRLEAKLWVNETPRGEAPYPTEDVANSLGQFIDADWVAARLDGTVDLRTEFQQSSELLGFLKYSSNLINNRDPSLWSVEKSTVPTYALPLDLLKLGFGTLAVSLTNFSTNHLTVLPGGRIQIRDNTNENLVSLAWSALDLSRSLRSLANPNDVERAALTANQINDLVGPAGVQNKLYQLFTGTVVEALARRRASTVEIEVLYQFLVQAGDVLDNDYLRHLPRIPDSLVRSDLQSH